LINGKDVIFATPTARKGRKQQEAICNKQRVETYLKSKNKERNFFKKACEIKKKLYFCSRLPGQPLRQKRGAENKVRYVHRHIGLTA